jgi:hypothetical protein
MTTAPQAGPRALAHFRPALIHVVGALAFLAITTQFTANASIDAWLESALFAAGSPGPEAVLRAPGVWAVPVGHVSPMSALHLDSIVQVAAHYQVLATAIAWTLAASAAAVWVRVDSRPLVETTRRRPGYAVPVLSPAAV